MSDRNASRGPLLPVEPLGDDAWARIGANLQAQLDAVPRGSSLPAPFEPERSTTWTAATVLAAAAALVLMFVGTEPDLVRRATPPMRVTAHAAPSLTQAGDSDIWLEPHTALEVAGDGDQGYTVRLEHGEASFAVPPRMGRPTFRVHAADVEVVVVGTRFTVAADQARVGVKVNEGTVRVRRGSQTVTVHAGERWSTTEGHVAAPPEPPEPLDEPTTKEPAAKDAPPARTGPRKRTLQDGSTPAKQRPRTARGQSPQQRFEAAAALEASRPERALKRYLRLSQGDGPWAANALFAAARLRLELDRTEGAHVLLRRYLRRFPEGPNARDARRLLQEGTP